MEAICYSYAYLKAVANSVLNSASLAAGRSAG